MLELEEANDQLKEAVKKEGQLLRNCEQANRFAVSSLKTEMFSIINVDFLIDCRSLELVKMEDAKKAARVRQLETELTKKNKEIIDREKERQELSRRVEEVEGSKEKLIKDMENGKHQESLKASYEKVKWENMSQISSLKQQNAALTEEVNQLKATVDILKTTNDDLRRATEVEEADSLALEKKDRQILSLEKKLAKANERLNQGSSKAKVKKVESSMDFLDTEFDERGKERELSEDEVEMAAPPSKLRRFSFLAPITPCRFSVFSNSAIQKRKLVPFMKVCKCIVKYIFLNMHVQVGALDDLTCRLPSPSLVPSLSVSDVISSPCAQVC